MAIPLLIKYLGFKALQKVFTRRVLKGEDCVSETRMWNSCQRLKIYFDRLILTSLPVDKKNLIYTVEMGTTVIYGWFWGFAKSLYCRGVLKGEDRDSETRVVD